MSDGLEPNEFIRFLKIAKGSIGETRNQLCISSEICYITKEEYNRINAGLEKLAAKTGKLIAYLERVRKNRQFKNK